MKADPTPVDIGITTKPKPVPDNVKEVKMSKK